MVARVRNVYNPNPNVAAPITRDAGLVDRATTQSSSPNIQPSQQTQASAQTIDQTRRIDTTGMTSEQQREARMAYMDQWRGQQAVQQAAEQPAQATQIAAPVGGVIAGDLTPPDRLTYDEQVRLAQQQPAQATQIAAPVGGVMSGDLTPPDRLSYADQAKLGQQQLPAAQPTGGLVDRADAPTTKRAAEQERWMQRKLEQIAANRAAEQVATAGPTQSATTAPAPAPRQEVSSYQAPALTETGRGTTYRGREGSVLLGETQAGLISMLQPDNPFMELERAAGRRYAESRGLGGSSFAGRAAEGAAISAAMPMVTQAQALSSQERMAAQQASAQSEIAARSRRLSELQQQQELAVRSGDASAARQLDRDMQQEQGRLDMLIQQEKTAAVAGENILGREQESRLQQERIAAGASESALGREFEGQLQQERIVAGAGESALEREQAGEIAAREARRREEELAADILARDKALAAKGDEAAAGRVEQQSERDLRERMSQENLTLEEAKLEQRRDEAAVAQAAEERRLEAAETEAATAREFEAEQRATELAARESERALDRQLQEALQDTDVNYKKWLEEATFGHQEILNSSQLAADTYRSFTESAANILNNPETTPAQKKAALDALKEGLAGGLALIGGISGLDLTQYLPGLEGGSDEIITTAPPTYTGDYVPADTSGYFDRYGTTGPTDDTTEPAVTPPVGTTEPVITEPAAGTTEPTVTPQPAEATEPVAPPRPVSTPAQRKKARYALRDTNNYDQFKEAVAVYGLAGEDVVTSSALFGNILIKADGTVYKRTIPDVLKPGEFEDVQITDENFESMKK